MSRWKHCWQWFSVDIIIFALIVLCLIGLSIMAALIPLTVHAAGCLSIDVPPQAVVGQPDGDTFYIFNLLPPGHSVEWTRK